MDKLYELGAKINTAKKAYPPQTKILQNIKEKVAVIFLKIKPKMDK